MIINVLFEHLNNQVSIMLNIYTFHQKIIETKSFLNNSLGRVLMFHEIDNQQKVKFNNVSISFESFKVLIETLMNRKYRFISLQDIANENWLTSKSIALTFDDGYAFLFNYLAQYLINNNIPFAVFATVDFLNKPNYLTNEQLGKLSEKSLCTIGSHSISHPLFRKLSDGKSRDELIYSRKILEEILSKEVDYFAFPYGSIYAVSSREIRYAKETGYKLAFSSVNSCLSRQSLKKRWFLPRINVNELNYNKILR